MSRRLFPFFVSLALLALPARAASRRAPIEGASTTEESRPLLPPDTELIDVPTAAVLDHFGFHTRTRFFAKGGLLESINFGVFPRLNLGASLNADRLIGTDDPLRLARPELQIKYRFYDGDRYIPAVAAGFDSQGWFYNRADKRYNQRQRGLYFVGTQEVGLPGLQFHAGMSISDFDSNDLGGVLAVSGSIEDKVKLMMEWDNINNFVDSRYNLGARFYINPSFNFEFSLRGIGQGGRFPDGVKRGPERVAQFKYTGSF